MTAAYTFISAFNAWLSTWLYAMQQSARSVSQSVRDFTVGDSGILKVLSNNENMVASKAILVHQRRSLSCCHIPHIPSHTRAQDCTYWWYAELTDGRCLLSQSVTTDRVTTWCDVCLFSNPKQEMKHNRRAFLLLVELTDLELSALPL